MVACKGCSKFFPNLQAESFCGRCEKRTPPDENAWPECSLCGKLFAFLEGDCDACCQTQGSGHVSQGLEYAMTHSVNPRTHGTPGRSLNANPLATHSLGGTHAANNDTDAANLQMRAAAIATNMSHGYANAQAFSMSRGGAIRVARPNMRTSMMPPPLPGLKPVPEITVKIVKVFDTKAPKVNINHMAETWGLPVSTLWCDVLRYVHVYIDSLWTSKKVERVYSATDLDIIYTLSGSQVPAAYLETTLGDLWSSTIKYSQVYIKDSDVKKRILELNVGVNCKATAAREDLEERMMYQSSKTYSSKRKASVSDPRAHLLSSKRSFSGGIDRGNKSMYSTNIQVTVHLEQHTVEKFICEFIESKGIRWTLMPGNVTINIEKESFAAGKTKKAFKLTIGREYFAAKLFYNIGHGDSNVSSSENTDNLKKELVVQALAGNLLKKFQEITKAQNISVYKLKIANAFLLTATVTQESWLVDPFIADAQVQKYSGTNKAGRHTDLNLAGKSCDAFAHFSLHQSMGELVLVDIQGIMEKTPFGGNCLVLFDLMAHSAAKDKGLGDQGTDGIAEFARQHVCNDICTALALEDATALAEANIYASEESEKNDGVLGTDAHSENPEPAEDSNEPAAEIAE